MKHKAFILFLIIGIALVFSAGCKKNKPPETPEKPSGPETVGVGGALKEYTTKAKDPNGDDIRYIFDWGDSKMDTTDYFKSESTAMASHAWDSVGTYAVKVEAQDAKDATSGWSAELEVTVIENNPPNTPTILGVPYGRPNQQYTFKTIVIDPNGDDVAVKFDWDLSGRIPTWSTWFASGDTISDTITYTVADTYRIKVLAKDILGDTSAWSAEFRFVVSADAWSFIPGVGGEEFFSSPALITTGTSVTHIIVGCDDGYVYCLDTLGNEKWHYPPTSAGESFNSSPLIGPDNVIYIGDDNGTVHAINPDGTIKWSKILVATGEGFNSSPAINLAGDIIYIGCENETLYAINTSNGDTAWTFGAQGAISSSPAIATDGAIVFGDEGDTGRLYILNTNGTVRHTFLADNQIFSSPAINGDKIYFAASETLIYAIDTTGALLYTYLPDVREEIVASPSIGPTGIIYLGDRNNRLFALNPDLTPVSTWEQTFTLDGISSSAAIGADGLIYIVDDNDNLYAYDNTGGTGQEVWTVRISISGKSSKVEELKPSPVIGPNGWIYAASSDGIYAFKRNTTLASTPWPMFRHDMKHSGRVGGPKR